MLLKFISEKFESRSIKSQASLFLMLFEFLLLLRFNNKLSF